jgi:hypothetical protein
MTVALVCKNEPIINFDGTSGYRVAEVFQSQPWEPAEDHMFVDCGTQNVNADEWYYDTSTNSLTTKPIKPIEIKPQPTTSNTQTL